MRLAEAREEARQLSESGQSSSESENDAENENNFHVNELEMLNEDPNLDANEMEALNENDNELEVPHAGPNLNDNEMGFLNDSDASSLTDDRDDSDMEDRGSEVEDDENSESEEENDGQVDWDPADMDLFLLESLRAWARRGVSGRKVNQLLCILKVAHPFLPMTRKTLLQTPSANNIHDVGGGLFWYKGIMPNIQSRIDLQYLTKFNEVVVDINIDGIPIFNSNSSHFFPILGCFQGQDEPFIIAVWYGPDKEPDDLNGFFQNFTAEVEHLQIQGCRLFNNDYPFRIRRYILDAVARSFVKCIIAHNGRYSCEKCDVRGVWFRHRMVYTDLDAPLRTDESFRNRDQPLHHTAGVVSPLEAIGTGMVSMFVLDGLHLVYLGAFKRWLWFILNQAGPFLLDDEELFGVSEALLEIKEWTPIEFNRKPRPLKRTGNHFKGHELRRLALYDGIKAFRNLDENLYHNYLLLQSALYILSSAHLRDLIPIARDLLRQFIRHARRIFTRVFVVYNVHSLSHLASDCDANGSIDDFAAFKFENFLGVMKHCLRSGYLPLHQIFNRDAETDGHLTNPGDPINPDEITLSREHVRLGRELVQGTQYQMLQTGSITLTLHDKDSCFVTSESDVVILSNIVRSINGEIFLIGRKFEVKDCAYNFPMDSTLLGIFKVSNLDDERRVWRIDQLSQKCYLMPDGESFIAVPLVHFHRQ